MGGPICLHFVWCPLFVALVLASAPAAGQSHSLAESLFRDARAAMRSGDYEKACPKLAESQRLDPSQGTLLNLGICNARRGRTATAWAQLREVLETSRDDDPRAAMAKREIAALEPLLAWGRLFVEPLSDDTTMRLDGIELKPASLGTQIALDPGEHVLSVSGTAGRLREERFRITQGQHLDVRIALEESDVRIEQRAARPPESPSAPRKAPPVQHYPERRTAPRRPATDDRGRASRHAAYVAGGIGAAGFVTSLTFTALALGQSSTVDDHCRQSGCDPSGLAAAERGALYLRVADVGVFVGVLGAGVATFFLWRSSRERAAIVGGPNQAVLSYVTALP